MRHNQLCHLLCVARLRRQIDSFPSCLSPLRPRAFLSLSPLSHFSLAMPTFSSVRVRSSIPRSSATMVGRRGTAFVLVLAAVLAATLAENDEENHLEWKRDNMEAYPYVPKRKLSKVCGINIVRRSGLCKLFTIKC